MATQREITVEEAPVIVRIQVGGTLQVQGKEGAIVRAESSHGEPTVELTDDVVEVTCARNCVVSVPRQAQLEIDVKRDLGVDHLDGGVGIIYAGGIVRLAAVGEIFAKKIAGDLHVAQAAAVNADQVRGNVHIDGVRGPVSVNAKGNVHVQQATGSTSINCKGNARLGAVAGERIRVNAKGDVRLDQCRGDIGVTAAGNIKLSRISSQKVQAVAKGDIQVDFAGMSGGQAKIVTGGDLHIQNREQSLHRSKGVYTLRFGQGDALLSLVSKGNIRLAGVEVDGESLQGVNEKMAAELGGIGAELNIELGALGAEMGREFGNLGRDIARQVQSKVQRKLRVKMKEMGKRAAAGEWGDKSWPLNFSDLLSSSTPSSRDAPFDPVKDELAGEPVSEEERALVLRMLEKGKISAAEAATLLEALGEAG